MNLRSGTAFWSTRSGLIRSYPALDRDLRADVAVIGAGITGALVAHELSGAGADVIVIDKRDVASGSTAATTGLLMYETDSDLSELIAMVGSDHAVRAWREGRQAIERIGALASDLDRGDCRFSARDSLYLASSALDVPRLRLEFETRARYGFAVEWLESTDLSSRYGIDAPHSAIRSLGDAQIDAYRFTHALLDDVTRAGVRVFDRTSVLAADADRDGVTLRTDRGPTIRASHIVWAAGYEGVEAIQKRVGRFYSTWVSAGEPLRDLSQWPDSVLIWETARPYLYARLTDDGRPVVGGEDEPFTFRHNSDRRRARKTRRLAKRLREILPAIDFEPVYEWSGVFSNTKDGLPYIGTLPDHPRAWMALGYGGNGITFSMIAADLVRDAWLGVKNDLATIFRFGR